LTKSPLLMTAWSPAATPVLLAGSWTGGAGAGRGGSGVDAGCWGSDWLGFHIALKMNSFSVPSGTQGDAKAMARLSGREPKPLQVPVQVAFRATNSFEDEGSQRPPNSANTVCCFFILCRTTT